jgi:prepilin-type N-terminal cleavage/methylation domain-containing protein
VNKQNQAFSLIELSIVILVIGVLIAGVISGSKLIDKSRLKVAQNLTRNSPVAGIEDLMVWYETSLDESLEEDLDAANSNITLVTTWYDSNPQTTSKLNATNTISPPYYAYFFPKFVESDIRGIPVVNFKSGNDYIKFNVNDLIGSDLTMFIVSKNNNSSNDAVFLSSPSLVFAVGFITNFRVLFNSNSVVSKDLSAIVNIGHYLIHTVQRNHNSSNNVNYWVNGGNDADDTRTATGVGINDSEMRIGAAGDVNIAEIIIFNRDLKSKERQSVESYLSQKYGIEIAY